MKKMTIRKMLERIVVTTNKRRVKNIVLVSTDGEIVEAEFAVDLIRTLTDWNILWEVTVISEKFYEDRFVVIFDPNIEQVKAANRKERENVAVYKSITFDNRKKIAALYAKGMSISDISDEVGVALRTLYVELKRGTTGKLDQNQRPAYDPVLAQRTYQENIRRRGSGPKRKEVKK